MSKPHSSMSKSEREREIKYQHDYFQNLKEDKERYEHKLSHNKEYMKTYKDKHGLALFGAYVDKDIASQIDDYLKANGLTRKEFIELSYDRIRNEM